LVVNIKTPSDNTLDKVRVDVGTTSTSTSLFAAGNLVYEGTLQASVKTDKYTNKAKNHIGIEYFNDSGKVYRSSRPKPVYMIDDMGPWDYVSSAAKFIQGNEELGFLDNTITTLPSQLILYQKAMNDAFARITAKHGTAGIVTFPTFPVSTEMNMFTVNGEIIALVNNSAQYSATAARTQASFDALEAMTETERTLVVGGFKWRIEPIYHEDLTWLYDQIAHAYQTRSTTYAPFSKRVAMLTDLPSALLAAYNPTVFNGAAGLATFHRTGTPGVWDKWVDMVNTADQTDLLYSYGGLGVNTSTCQFQLRYVGRE
jgi:hypothetical protein